MIDYVELREVNGMWMPAYDRMFAPFAKAGAYQKSTYNAALKHVREFGAAIDVGANIGFWSREMAKHFEIVFAFEPVWENYRSLLRNTDGYVVSVRTALGNASGEVALSNLGSDLCGGFGHYPGRLDTVSVPLATLDSFRLWERESIGLIKIDVQGMETDVILGGEQTIRTSKPVMVVEVQQAGKVDPRPMKILTAWGAKIVKSVSADRIVAWNPKVIRKPRIYPYNG